MPLISLKKRLKKDVIINFFKNNRLFILLSFFLLVGVLLGALLLKQSDENTQQLINILFLSDFKERLSKTLFEIFIISTASSFIFVIISFFMGLSLWGFILSPVIPFIRGVCIGLAEGYLYSVYGLKGIGFYLLVFLPGVFISSIAILLMTKEAMQLSNKFSSMIFFENKLINAHKDIRLYILRVGCILILIVIAAVIDVLFNFLFSRFFLF